MINYNWKEETMEFNSENIVEVMQKNKREDAKYGESDCAWVITP